MNRVERLTTILLLLQERSRTSLELADLLQVSKRTVLRDVQALSFMGVPVLSREGAGGGYSLPDSYRMQPPELNVRESLLLMMAMRSLEKLGESPFKLDRETLLGKIEASLPERHREAVRSLLDKVEVETPRRSRPAPMLEPLMQTLHAERWLELQFLGDEGEQVLVFRPSRLFVDRGFWYVDGLTAAGPRWLRVDRVLAFRPAEALPEEPKVLPYDHPSHPVVKVVLSGRGLRTVERDPHLGAQVEGAEAPFLLEFRSPPSELDWYARYFGGMGGDALVREPEELIVRIRQRAAEVLALYEEGED